MNTVQLRFNSRPQDGAIGYYDEKGYVGPGPLWVQWRSVRHTQEQSDSDYNISKVHIKRAGDELHALCGKDIQPRVTDHLIRPDELGQCEKCKKAWKEGKR